MSNIYIQEPPTSGKVLLKTTVGDIDVELWSKEAPKACRNFVQLCMEGYYDGTIFHRVVRDFIVQGGDPTGTGHGGESIYGQPFKDEPHTRLRFVRRGLVAMANAGPNDNGSQFFFTMAATPELFNKHTIFGKVTGETVYNMIKLQDCEVDSNERPRFPHKINKTLILSNPFDDIVPRAIKRGKKSDEDVKKTKSQSKATKNFNLLSFGEEAEEDEQATKQVTETLRGKSKSSHDLINDPKLSSVPAVDVTDLDSGKTLEKGDNKQGKADDSDIEDGELDEDDSADDLEKERERIRKKLKKVEKEEQSEEISAADDRNISEEVKKDVKKEVSDSKGKETLTPSPLNIEEKSKKKMEPDALAEYREERQKYKDLRKHQPRKGTEREEMTLALLAQFQNKLSSVKKAKVDYSDDEEEEDEKKADENDEGTDFSWMSHTLTFEVHNRKVLDANIHDAERYEIFDPRNPINKRRRETSKVAKEK